MSGLSNYPPGVTGMEPYFLGAPEDCVACGRPLDVYDERERRACGLVCEYRLRREDYKIEKMCDGYWRYALRFKIRRDFFNQSLSESEEWYIQEFFS